jgi:hypothetical protein
MLDFRASGCHNRQYLGGNPYGKANQLLSIVPYEIRGLIYKSDSPCPPHPLSRSVPKCIPELKPCVVETVLVPDCFFLTLYRRKKVKESVQFRLPSLTPQKRFVLAIVIHID